MAETQQQIDQRAPNPGRQPDLGALALERGVPVNIEAEMFVLGTVLLDDTKFSQVAGSLDEVDFYTEKHRRIIRCMHGLHERGERIEFLMLADELKKFGWLENVGGYAYLAQLTEGMPRLSSIESYVRIVKNKSVLRKLISTAQGIIANCLDESGREVDEVLADSELAVMKVGNELLRSGLESPRETLDGIEGGVSAFLDPTKRPKGLFTPFLAFNEMTNGLRGGQLVVLAGRPAMGKTAMALNIATHVAISRGDEPGRPVAIFSLEMSREALLTRMLCSLANVDQMAFRQGRTSRYGAQLSSALNDLVQSRLFIDDSADLNIIELAAKCRRLQSEHGLALVVVDYLQLMASKGRVENRVQEISSFSRGLKLLAKDLDVPVLALSQLSRAPEAPGRKGHRPILSDLRDSGSIEQDADVVCFVFREEVYKPDDKTLEGTAELIIGKQRNGPTGRVRLAFRNRFAKFVDPVDEQSYPEEEYAGADDGGDQDEPPPF